MVVKASKEEIAIWENTTNLVISFSKIEDVITDLISNYYGEASKRGLLKKAIIENEPFSKKYEIFKRINQTENILDDNAIGQLPKMIKIRNAILHNKIESNGVFLLNLDGKLKEYGHKELFNLYKEGYKLTHETLSLRLSSYTDKDEVKKIISDLSSVNVALRNYKGWFVDIVDLEIYDSEGDSISVDYPDYEYGVEDYEEEVEKTISKFIKDKYGVEEGTYVIEPNLEFSEVDED